MEITARQLKTASLNPASLKRYPGLWIVLFWLVMGCTPQSVKQGVDAMHRANVAGAQAGVKVCENVLPVGKATQFYIGMPIEQLDITDEVAMSDLSVNIQQAAEIKGLIIDKTTGLIIGIPVIGSLFGLGLKLYQKYAENKVNRDALVTTVKAGNKIIEAIKSDAVLTEKVIEIYKDTQAALPGARQTINTIREVLAEKKV